MEWWLQLALFFGILILLMLTGLPIFTAFLLTDVVFIFWLWGGSKGLEIFILSLYSSLAKFSFLPIPFFVFMGEVVFSSGITTKIIQALDNWVGRMPGRLSFLAVAAGTTLSTMTGSTIATGIVLTRSLVPEMEKRGYKKPMTLGPVLGSAGLAIMIPPSIMAVLIGGIGEISVGKLLIAIIIPGLLMAALYATLILLRCRLQPHLAPPYEVTPKPITEKLVATSKYILPLGFIIFLVTGVIFLGIATPSEAAATGATGSLILVAAHKRLNWQLIKKSVGMTIEVSGMIFMIIAGSLAYSQVLAWSGATVGLSEAIISNPLAPIGVVVAMAAVGFFLVMFMSTAACVIITIPLFVPVIESLGFDPVWFGVLYLICMETGTTSPPFGLTLFAVHGVAPPGTTLGDCSKAALPWVGCDLIVIMLIMVFPAIALWLPSLGFAR